MHFLLRTLLTAFLFSLATNGWLAREAAAQDDQDRFERALELYQEGRFTDAATRFSAIDIPEAMLFTGKSYFAAGQYKLSSHYLNRVPTNAPEQIYDDSRYTLALNDFQTGNFGRALDRLHILKEDASIRNIRGSADRFYDQTMNYLTVEQRKTAFYQSTLPEVQLELVTAAFNWVDRQTAGTLVNTLEHSLVEMQDSAAVVYLHEQLNGMSNTARSEHGRAPDGITYDIGVALPDSEDEAVLNISRSMYYGISQAAEEFNRRNNDRKIALHYGNPGDGEHSPEHVMTDFAWINNADLVIGPLFSDSAYRMTRLAEQYRIPLITPLANSDTLNLDNPYVYQINPTFSQRGRAMARFAVNELGLTNLAIITERSTPAEEEAYAFRDEASRLGAEFVHIFNENFEAQGYNVSEITPWFAGDTLNIDTEKYELKPVDGLFLATGGPGGSNLINLVMTDLEALRSNVVVLGNEEMGNAELSAQQLRRLDIYYPEIFHTDESREEVGNFRVDYRNSSGMEADRFSFIGYDVATYLFRTLEEVQNPARLKDAIKKQPVHNGLTVNIDFSRGNINQGLRIFQLQPQGPVEAL